MASTEDTAAQEAALEQEKARLVTDLWKEKEAHRETKNRCQFLLDLLHKQTRDMRQVMLSVKATPGGSNSSGDSSSLLTGSSSPASPLSKQNVVQSLEKEKNDLQRNVTQLQNELQDTLSSFRLENERLAARIRELEQAQTLSQIDSQAQEKTQQLAEANETLTHVDLIVQTILYSLDQYDHLRASDDALSSASVAPGQVVDWTEQARGESLGRARLARERIQGHLQIHQRALTTLESAVLVHIRTDADLDGDEEDGDQDAEQGDVDQVDSAESARKEKSEEEIVGGQRILERAEEVVKNLSASGHLLKEASADIIDVKQRFASLLMKESRKFEQTRKEYEDEIARLRARDQQRAREIEMLRDGTSLGEGGQESSRNSTRRPSELGERFRKQTMSAPQRIYEKSGWLTKQGSKWKTWKTRYFVLRGSSLMIYKDLDKRNLLGIISITGVQCRSVDGASGDKKFYFELKGGENGMMGQKQNGNESEIIRYPNLLVYASTEAERTEWIAAINDNSLLDV